MKNVRFRTALLVLCALLALTVYGYISVERRIGALLQQTARAQAVLADGGDVQTELTALQRQWENDRTKLHLFIASDPLAELNRNIARLRPDDTLDAELSAIAADLTWLRTQERVIF